MGSFLVIVCIAVTVGLIDIRVLPSLQAAGIGSTAVVDVVAALVPGILGLRFALDNGLPVWFRKWTELRRPHHFFLTASLSLFIILLTAGLYLVSPLTQLPAWAASLTPERAILLALRAALGEEVLFRFFLFGLVVWMGRKIRAERGVSLIVAAVLSALAFTLIHSGFYIPFLEGLLLAVIYFESGLTPAMVVHFCADAIAFLILLTK